MDGKEYQFLVYKAEQDDVTVNALIQNETIWLTQKAMAELFGVGVPAISKHLKNIFEDGELKEEVVISKMETTTPHGAIQGKTQTNDTNFYNLDAIISVGYRVNSRRATQFRIWATGVLREYMIKGFALDDERLKQAKTAFGTDYFRELLERVRSIRASERRIWQQVTDIFAECSIDYDKDADITHEFYAMVQNKFHYAITGQTAPEIIYTHVDHSKENMGLTTWKNAPVSPDPTATAADSASAATAMGKKAVPAMLSAGPGSSLRRMKPRASRRKSRTLYSSVRRIRPSVSSRPRTNSSRCWGVQVSRIASRSLIYTAILCSAAI